MKDTQTKAIIAGFGTAVLAAYIHGLLVTLLGFSPYGFFVAAILPMGALIWGFLAVSGFYFVAKRDAEFQRPQFKLLLAMMAGGCLSLFLAYWFEYMGAFLPNISFSSVMSFGDYLQASATQSDIYMSGITFVSEAGAGVAVMVIVQAVVFLMAPIITYKQLPGSGGFLDE